MTDHPDLDAIDADWAEPLSDDGLAQIEQRAETARPSRGGGGMSLYPTPTRLALLGEVDRERIRRCYFSDGEADLDINDRRVNARMAEMERAGWVYLDPKVWTTVDVVTTAAWELRHWRLTGAGRAVLAGEVDR